MLPLGRPRLGSIVAVPMAGLDLMVAMVVAVVVAVVAVAAVVLLVVMEETVASVAVQCHSSPQHVQLRHLPCNYSPAHTRTESCRRRG